MYKFCTVCENKIKKNDCLSIFLKFIPESNEQRLFFIQVSIVRNTKYLFCNAHASFDNFRAFILILFKSNTRFRYLFQFLIRTLTQWKQNKYIYIYIYPLIIPKCKTNLITLKEWLFESLHLLKKYYFSFFLFI